MRVRHAANRREPARCRRSSSGGDAFFVALAGLAQVNMQIDKSGSDNESTGIEFVVRAAASLARRGNLGHLPVTQQDVHGGINPRGRIDQMPSADEQAVILRASVH